jgi:hypothetical protein
VSDVQCSILKNNYFNGFSSVRAFQRYIIYNFSLPFELYPIFGCFVLKKIEQQKRITPLEKKAEFLPLWGPLSAKGKKKLSWCGLGRRGAQKPVPQFIINETPRECTKSIQLFLLFSNASSAKVDLLYAWCPLFAPS